ncbi:MAG: hypothetical protein H7836_11280 [Magnetococcus sp. YQC-3]
MKAINNLLTALALAVGATPNRQFVSPKRPSTVKTYQPKKPKTQQDYEALRLAEVKRARKNAKRLKNQGK